MGKMCIGVDVGGTSVKLGLFETSGTLVYKWEVPTRKDEVRHCLGVIPHPSGSTDGTHLLSPCEN